MHWEICQALILGTCICWSWAKILCCTAFRYLQSAQSDEVDVSLLKISLQALVELLGNCGKIKLFALASSPTSCSQRKIHMYKEVWILCHCPCFEMSYLKVGYRVWSGQPSSARVLLVSKWSIEGLGDGTQIKSTDSRSWYAVSREAQEITMLRS